MKTCVAKVSKDIEKLKKLRNKLSIPRFDTPGALTEEVVSRLDWDDLTLLASCVDRHIKYLEELPVNVPEDR